MPQSAAPKHLGPAETRRWGENWGEAPEAKQECRQGSSRMGRLRSELRCEASVVRGLAFTLRWRAFKLSMLVGPRNESLRLQEFRRDAEWECDRGGWWYIQVPSHLVWCERGTPRPHCV